MPKMLRELSADPSLGLLGFFTALQGPRTVSVVQYWRDAESLIGYAKATDREHRPAWTAFNRAVRTSGGAVGIWHETYVVPRGAHESLYVDMPARGLGAAFGTTQASGPRATASGGSAVPRPCRRPTEASARVSRPRERARPVSARRVTRVRRRRLLRASAQDLGQPVGGLRRRRRRAPGRAGG